MNVAAIPAELRERRQWVCWRFEQREGKQTKPPWRVDASEHASADDPASWGSFEEALETLKAGKVDGIGYVFAADDPFCGVDLDRCRNGNGLHPDAAAIVSRLDSYTEWSPSQRGVHVLLRGSLPGSRRRKGQVEMYDRARFFCMTGKHVRGTPEAVEERQAELNVIYDLLFPPEPVPRERETQSAARRTLSSAPSGQDINEEKDDGDDGHRDSDHGDRRSGHDHASLISPLPLRLDDEQLLEQVRGSAQGAKFEALWSGHWQESYGSQSEADLALADLLAFWSGPDPARVDGLFRRSGLMRGKWDSRRGETTYGAQTVAKALAGRTDFYSRTSSSHLVPARPQVDLVPRPSPIREGRGETTLSPLVPSWRPLDLIALGAAAPEPPAIVDLFYLRKRHLLAGESEAAKTWLLLVAAAAELREERGVVWVDGDLVGGGDLLERLRSLGVEDASISELFLYFEAEEPLRDSTDLVAPLLERNGRLAVLDGFNPLLFLHDCDPDKGIGIESFMRRVVNPLRDAGAAVVLSDNVAKACEARGSWAIGSERKKSAVEVQLGMTAVDTFGRGRTGKFKLTIQKDRPGYLERPSPGLLVLVSDPDDGRCSWRIEPDHSVSDEGAFRPTNLMEKVSRYLELRAPQACSRKQIEDDVKGKSTALRTAIERLVVEGYAVEFPGEHGARLVKSERPFRESDEWEAA